MTLRAIVALGNPGPAYAETRHNAGFMLADLLAERWGLPPFRRQGRAHATAGTVGGALVILLKPRTYMNLSGAAVAPLVHDAAFDTGRDLLVLVDDIALPLGHLRIRPRGSDGGHNGLKSIASALGSTEYARLRIGIGPLPPDVEDQADWVLEPFDDEEWPLLRDALPTMAQAVECWLAEGIDAAMNQFNQRGTPSD